MAKAKGCIIKSQSKFAGINFANAELNFDQNLNHFPEHRDFSNSNLKMVALPAIESFSMVHSNTHEVVSLPQILPIN